MKQAAPRKFKKLTAEQLKEVWKQPDDWTKVANPETPWGQGGQAPKRSTDSDPRGH